jgi:hypothetical protein
VAGSSNKTKQWKQSKGEKHKQETERAQDRISFYDTNREKYAVQKISP